MLPVLPGRLPEPAGCTKVAILIARPLAAGCPAAWQDWATPTWGTCCAKVAILNASPPGCRLYRCVVRLGYLDVADMGAAFQMQLVSAICRLFDSEEPRTLRSSPGKASQVLRTLRLTAVQFLSPTP